MFHILPHSFDHSECNRVKVSKMDRFANSVDPDEVAHNELPHLDLNCLPCSLEILIMI